MKESICAYLTMYLYTYMIYACMILYIHIFKNILERFKNICMLLN